MPLTASAVPAVRFLDSEYHLISPRYARFRCAGREYEGDLALDDELLIQLRALELRPDEYGHALFEALFPPGSLLRDGFREVLASAEREGSRLRFRLHLAGRIGIDLHALYWELLRDESRDLALGRSPETAFSRYATVPRQPGEPVEGKLRLLCVIAAPSNAADYNLAEIERGAAMERLAAALQVEPDSLQVDFLEPPATPGRLRSKLVEGAYHVVHIFGHGLVMPQDRQARLVLESESGEASFVSEKVLAEIFLGDKTLRLVTLVACHGGAFSSEDSFSGLAGRLVSRGLPSVVAMRRAVTLDMAERFTDHLYRELARTGRIDSAMNEARHQLYFRDPSGLAWSSPMLFTRLPNGRLWKRRQDAPVPDVALVAASLGAGSFGPEPGSPAALRRRGLLGRRLAAGGRAALRAAVWLPALVFSALLTLSFLPASRVPVEMDARVDRVAFRLNGPHRTLGPWRLRRLIAPGTVPFRLDSFAGGAGITGPGVGSADPAVGFILTSPEQDDGGDVSTLTLESGVLQPGVEMVMEHQGGLTYRAVFSELKDPLLMNLLGSLELRPLGEPAEDLFFEQARVVELTPEDGVLELEVSFAQLVGDEVRDGAPVNRLNFDRIEESHQTGSSSVDRVSTLRGGTIRMGRSKTALHAQEGEALDLDFDSGVLTRMRLAVDGIRLGFSGELAGLTRTPPGMAAQQVLPSYLALWSGESFPPVWLGVTGALGVLAPLGARRLAPQAAKSGRGRAP